MSFSQTLNYQDMKNTAGNLAVQAADYAVAYARQIHAWALTERLGRRRYVFANIQAGIIGFIVAFTPLAIMFMLPDIDTAAPSFIATFIAVLAIAFMEVVFVATSLARLRDLAVSPYWVILGLVPYLNVLLFIWLALTKKQPKT